MQGARNPEEYKTLGRSCGKVFIRRRTKRFMYLCNDACATKDEGNDADGCFSAAFSEKRSQPLLETFLIFF
jgi:hypothetical protein